MGSFNDSRFDLIRETMRAAAVSQPAIDAFLGAVHRLMDGETGLLPEQHVEPIDDIPSFETLAPAAPDDRALFEQLAIIKLNGGLGTGMGLSGPKSLLPVRGTETFLDFIARQVLHRRHEVSCSTGGRGFTGGRGSRRAVTDTLAASSRAAPQERRPPEERRPPDANPDSTDTSVDTRRPVFLLMNSFSTQAASLQHLKRYPDLANDDGSLDFVQNKVPKLEPHTLAPVSWPDDPELEWCPPGHGDLYASLLGNDRLLDRLLDAGVRYLFASNADNLGATADPTLLRYFAESGLSFVMEVATRTDVDRKGGHLTRRKSDGRLVLRESAQCPPEDMPQFQDITRHRFFNTNNLWIQLEHLREALAAGGGSLPLPLIRNQKTVDPQRPESPPVLQLESAMGAAIECFDKSSAILIPRHRFAPVKTTNDLLAVRSDAYETRENGTVLHLVDSRDAQPPHVDLDSAHYKLLARFEELFAAGPPSLVDCQSLTVTGAVRFEADVRIRGEVSISNPSGAERTLPSGTYTDETATL